VKFSVNLWILTRLYILAARLDASATISVLAIEVAVALFWFSKVAAVWLYTGTSAGTADPNIQLAIWGVKIISKSVSPSIAVFIILLEDSPKKPMDSLELIWYSPFIRVLISVSVTRLEAGKPLHGTTYPFKLTHYQIDMNIIYLDHQQSIRYQFFQHQISYQLFQH
jgi:hypothetical protein